MPRNRSDWNSLEEHIRSTGHDMLGMTTMIGANELRKLAKLIYRHIKIHKDRTMTRRYITKKLNHLRENGYPEVWELAPLVNMLMLLDPVWEHTSEAPLILDEILIQQIKDEDAKE